VKIMTIDSVSKLVIIHVHSVVCSYSLVCNEASVSVKASQGTPSVDNDYRFDE
jgi:hypothetical protein